MPDYKYKGKLYSEDDVIAAAEAKNMSLEEYTSNYGIELVSEDQAETRTVNDYFVTEDELRGNESEVVQRLKAKLTTVGIDIDESGFGDNIQVRGKVQQALDSTNYLGNYITKDLFGMGSIKVGSNMSTDELKDSVNKVNEIIAAQADLSFLNKSKEKYSEQFEEYTSYVKAKDLNKKELEENFTEYLNDYFVRKEDNAMEGDIIRSLTIDDFADKKEYDRYLKWKAGEDYSDFNDKELKAHDIQRRQREKEYLSSKYINDQDSETREALTAIAYDKEQNIAKLLKDLPQQASTLENMAKDFDVLYSDYKNNPTKEKYEDLLKQQSLILNLQSDLQEAQNDYQDYAENVPLAIKNFTADYNRLSQLGSMFKDQGISIVYSLNELAKLADKTGLYTIASEKYLLDTAESIKSETGTYQQTIGVDEIKDFDDAGRWVASSATTLVPSLTMALAGKLAMPLFFASGFGGKTLDIELQKKEAYRKIAENQKYLEENPDIDDFDRMRIEQEIKDYQEKLNVSDLQKYGSAITYGAAEVVFERLGTISLVKGVKNGIKALPPETIKQGAKFVGKKLGEGVFVEGGSEFLTTLTQNFVDIGVLGEDKSIFDGALESFAQGALMGAGINSLAGYQGMKAAISSELQNKAELKRQQEIIQQLKELTGIEFTNIPDASSLPSFPKEVQDLVNELIQEGTEIQQNIIARIGYDLSLDDLKQVGEINRQIRKLVDRLGKASMNRNITASQLQQIKNETSKQIDALEAQKEGILTNTAKQEQSKQLARENRINKDAQLGYQLYNQRIANESVLDILGQWGKMTPEQRKEYYDEAKLKLGKYADKDAIEKQALRDYTNKKYKEKILASAENAKAFAEDQKLDLNIQILDSTDAVIQAILDSEMSEADKALAIKKVKRGEFEGVYDGGNNIIVDLNAAIRNKRLGIVSHEVLHAFAKKVIGSDASVAEKGKGLLGYLEKNQKDLYVKVADRLENYLDENGNPTDQYYIEVLNALSDVFSDGDTPSVNVINQIKNFVNSILGKGLNLENNKDVFQFVLDYNKKAHFGKEKKEQRINSSVITPPEEDKQALYSFTYTAKQIDAVVDGVIKTYIPVETLVVLPDNDYLLLRRQMGNYFNAVYKAVKNNLDPDSIKTEEYIKTSTLEAINKKSKEFGSPTVAEIVEDIKSMANYAATKNKFELNVVNTLIAAKKLGFAYTPQIYKTRAEFLKAIAKDKVLLDEVKTTAGVYTFNGRIHIDQTRSVDPRLFISPQHELLHAILFATIGGPIEQKQLAAKVSFILEKENPKLWAEFTAELKQRYAKEQWGVEYFTVLSDVMTKNRSWEQNESILKRIGAIIEKILIKLGIKKEQMFDLKDPKQMFSFMKEYVKTMNSKKGLSDRAVASINSLYNPVAPRYGYKGENVAINQDLIDRALRIETNDQAELKAKFSMTRMKLERELTDLEDAYDNFEIDYDVYEQKKENILYKIKLLTAKEDEDKLNKKYDLSEKDYDSQELVLKLKNPNITKAEYEKTYALLLVEFDRLAKKAVKFDTSKGDIEWVEVRDYLRAFLPTIVEGYDPDTGNRFTTYMFSWIAPKAAEAFEAARLIAKGGYYEDKVADKTEDPDDLSERPDKDPKQYTGRKIRPLEILRDEQFQNLYRGKIAVIVQQLKDGLKVTEQNIDFVKTFDKNAKIGDVIKIDIQDLTFGNLIDLAPEVTAAWFNLPIGVYLDPKQNIDYADVIVDDENINKLSQEYPDVQVGMIIKSEAHMIQDAIIRMGPDLLKIMPKSNAAPDDFPNSDVKDETGQNFFDKYEYQRVKGTSLKIPPALLKVLYEETGRRSAGKSSQVVLKELKPMNHEQFLAYFGIFPTVVNGKRTYQRKYDRTIGQRLKGMASLYGKLATNSEVRTILRQSPTFENMVGEQNIAAGKSEAMFSQTKKAETLSRQFNNIIESKTGIEAAKTYSEAAASVAGKDKGKYDLFIPPSAEDFVGLLYKFLDTGKKGDRQMQWFKVNLLIPYATAMSYIDRDRATTARNMRALKKELEKDGFSKKELKSKIPNSDFTVEQAIRVYIWTDAGVEVPGLDLSEIRFLRRFVRESIALKNFAEKASFLVSGMILGQGTPAQIVKPSKHWLSGNLTTDMLENLNSGRRKVYLAQWQENVDAIFSKENMNKIEAGFGKNFRYALENVLERMRTGKNRRFGQNKLVNDWLDWLNGSVGAIMFFNTRSSVLQMISTLNFLNWSDNNPIMAAKAFSNQKQFWADWWYLFNSDYLTSRREGTRINVSENEIAEAAEKGGITGVISYLLQKGFLPTQIADSLAISMGGASFYRNRINSYIAEGIDPKKAEELAFRDFKETAEESQQSSRPDKISQEQSSSLGRLILAFANTPAQYARLTKKALLDIKNGRGDLKTNMSKLLYYGAVQNLIFSGLQNALFAIAFDEDDKYGEKDEKMQQAYVKTANSAVDSFLRGTGIVGAITAVVKNAIIKMIERSEKRTPDYAENLIYELLKISPPIYSKISKIRSAARTYEWEGRDIYDSGLALENPVFEISAQAISAATNLPLDRAVRKITNLKHATAHEVSALQSMYLLMGWPAWQLGLDPDDFTYGSTEKKEGTPKKGVPNWQKRLIQNQRKIKTKK